MVDNFQMMPASRLKEELKSSEPRRAVLILRELARRGEEFSKEETVELVRKFSGNICLSSIVLFLGDWEVAEDLVHIHDDFSVFLKNVSDSVEAYLDKIAASLTPSKFCQIFKRLSPRQRAEALRWMQRNERKDLVGIAAYALKDANARVRANAVEALEKLVDDTPKLVRLLKHKLNDENNRVRANAALAIWRRTGIRGFGILEEMIRTGTLWQRASAAYALGEIGTPLAFEILTRNFPTGFEEIDRNIIKAVAKCDVPQKIEWLLSIDPADLEEDVYVWYVEAITELAKENTQLKQRLEDLCNLPGKRGAIARLFSKGI